MVAVAATRASRGSAVRFGRGVAAAINALDDLIEGIAESGRICMESLTAAQRLREIPDEWRARLAESAGEGCDGQA